jgi:membrane-anchored mycosin MYCP
VDPVAALTWELPAPDDGDVVTQIAAPVVPEPVDQRPRNIALGGTAALVLVVAATALAVHRRKDRVR